MTALPVYCHMNNWSVRIELLVVPVLEAFLQHLTRLEHQHAASRATATFIERGCSLEQLEQLRCPQIAPPGTGSAEHGASGGIGRFAVRPDQSEYTHDLCRDACSYLIWESRNEPHKEFCRMYRKDRCVMSEVCKPPVGAVQKLSWRQRSKVSALPCPTEMSMLVQKRTSVSFISIPSSVLVPGNPSDVACETPSAGEGSPRGFLFEW